MTCEYSRLNSFLHSSLERINKARESGLYGKWSEDVLRGTKFQALITKDHRIYCNYSVIELKNLYDLYLLILIGTAFGYIIYVIEYILAHQGLCTQLFRKIHCKGAVK